MRRQFQSAANNQPSINPVTGSGRGTKQERREDNGLNTSDQNVISIRRGEKIDRSPLTETHDNLIESGMVRVEARSGNDSAQHDEEGSDSDLAFDTVGDVPAIATATPTKIPTIALVAAGIGLVWWLTKR